MHRIVKLPDTEYRIFGQNVTLDIGIQSDVREDNFLELDIRHFPDSDQIPSVLKKKPIGKKIVILQQCIRYYSIMNMYTYF